jgi:hypothetical protein
MTQVIVVSQSRSVADRVILVIDMLGSGEFMTITINNATNKAVSDYMTVELHKRDVNNHWEGIQQLLESYMGDDSITIYEAGPLSDGRVYTQEAIKYMLETFEVTSQENGLILSAKKTIARTSFYEYLKKMAVFGFTIPRLSQLMMITSERNSFKEVQLSAMVSHVAFLKEYISRGANHDFVLSYIHFLFNIKRRVKHVVKDSTPIFATLPFPVLYTPLEMGGIGLVPYSAVGPNSDIIMYHVYNATEQDEVSHAAYILDIKINIIKDKIAESILKEQDVFRDGIDFLQKSLKNNVSVRSMEANRWLADNGFPTLKNLLYTNSPERWVKRAIADNSKIGDIIKEEKNLAAAQYKARS